ncbi:MAG: ATP-dependent DNA helicase [Desulfobacterales bacterium]|nr:MAG: ATP-dependent DNA helicase [Desulfobacterales bacterium]
MVASGLKSELNIAVRALVEHVLRAGDLAFEFLGFSRPADAIRAHQRIQNSRPDTYRAEVPISHQIETDQFVLLVSGRIDGIYTGRDGVVIEEIKTTTRSLDAFEQEENPLHWGQLKSYAYLYAIQQDLDQIDAQLTYYQMDSGEIREFRRSFTLTVLEDFFNDLVSRYLQWAATIVDWRRRRDESIQTLEFPFAAYRPGQRRMAVEIYRTIHSGNQLLVQAATGIGKTMAAIFPALKAVAEGLNPKIFYLTARTTGRIAAEKALEELWDRGLRLKAVTLTAKDKACFNPGRTCSPEECEFARGHFDRVGEARQDIFQQDALTREVIAKVAGEFRVCPFEFALELSLWADCIICDYNYAFDPRVFLRRFFQDENGDYTFLIDEAHNLVDRSREMFSAVIHKQSFLDVRRAVRKELPQVFQSLGKINGWLVKARKRCAETGSPRATKQPPDDLYPSLRHFLKITERWLARNVNAPFREALLELYFEVTGFMRVAEQYDNSYATCFEQIEKDLTLKLFCIDPSGQLRNALKRCRAAVLFSATMAPLDYFKKVLGCDESARQLILPSPFPRENFGLYISDRVSTFYRHREKTKTEVAQEIRSLVRQKQGNYLFFFPSYEYMRMVYAAYKGGDAATETILQTPAMTESERDRFLQRFSQETPRTLVGFAVMGGIFGEGIDLKGERLSGAAIVGVGLPGISLERELIREYFGADDGAGFEFAYLYPGINRVLQAAGRVIRSENDVGVVLLIDPRYATPRYKSLLPEEWHPVHVQNEHQFARHLQSFWRRA